MKALERGTPEMRVLLHSFKCLTQKRLTYGSSSLSLPSLPPSCWHLLMGEKPLKRAKRVFGKKFWRSAEGYQQTKIWSWK